MSGFVLAKKLPVARCVERVAAFFFLGASPRFCPSERRIHPSSRKKNVLFLFPIATGYILDRRFAIPALPARFRSSFVVCLTVHWAYGAFSSVFRPQNEPGFERFVSVWNNRLQQHAKSSTMILRLWLVSSLVRLSHFLIYQPVFHFFEDSFPGFVGTF